MKNNAVQTTDGTTDKCMASKIKLLDMVTAYRFYQTIDITLARSLVRMKAVSKGMYLEMLLIIHSELASSSTTNVLGMETNYTYKTLVKETLKCITESSIKQHIQNIKRSLDRSNNANKEIPKQILLIYYCLLFNSNFKKEIEFLCNHKMAVNESILLHRSTGAKVAEMVISYAGEECIECQQPLKLSYRKTREDNRGSVAILYHKHSIKLALYNIKKCTSCKINYHYNKICYEHDCIVKDKQNTMLFIAPQELEYFALSKRSTTFIHKSIMESINEHQFCNKSLSIQMWTQHYNKEWNHRYNELKAIPQLHEIPHIELDYHTVWRYYYFHALLSIITSLKVENAVIQSIVIDSHSQCALKLAEILNYDDIVNIQKLVQSHTMDEISIDNLNLVKYHNYFFIYIFNKYKQKLESMPIPQLSLVPVKLNETNEIIIFPGHFVLYGDGNQKINRPKCAYPTIIAQYDELKENGSNHNSKNALNVSDHQNNATLSHAKYYACGNTPVCFNKCSTKCCAKHAMKLNSHHQIKMEEIPHFIEWFHLNNSIARLKGVDVEVQFNVYGLNDDDIQSMKGKQKDKLDILQNKLAKLFDSNRVMILNFKKYMITILAELRENINDNHKQRPKRKCVAKTNANIRECSIQDDDQELAAVLRTILPEKETYDFEHIATPSDCREWLHMEIRNNSFIKQTKGCRKAEYFSPATAGRTNGINVLCTCSGFILRLREELIRETPTGVIVDIADACLVIDKELQYINRIEALGYDMMCRLYHTMRNLITNKLLPDDTCLFWISLIDRLFVDIWHIYTHKDELCSQDATNSLFHPKLKKFEGILHSIDKKMQDCNEMIAEQFWSTMNASNQMKAMNQEKFELFLILKKQYYNDEHQRKLERKGWTFVPIIYFEQLRNISAPGTDLCLPETDDLKKSNELPLNYVKPKQTNIADIIKLIEMNRNTDMRSNTQNTKQNKSTCTIKHQRPAKRRKLNSPSTNLF